MTWLIQYTNPQKTIVFERIYNGSFLGAKIAATKGLKPCLSVSIYVDGDINETPIIQKQFFMKMRKAFWGKWECKHLGSCKYHWSHQTNGVNQ